MTPTKGGIRRITKSFLQWNSRHFVTLRFLENEIMNDLKCGQAHGPRRSRVTRVTRANTCEHVRTRANTCEHVDTETNKNSGTHVIPRDPPRDITWYHVISRDRTWQHVIPRD